MQTLIVMIRKIQISHKALGIVAALLATTLIAAQPRSCTDSEVLANREVICAAIKRSPHYSGGKLDAAGMKELHRWIRKTNFTLDDLDCPK